MSSDPAISVQGLCKTYQLTTTRDRSTTLGEAVSRLATFRRPSGPRRAFEALSDLSFDVMPGEAFAIVGRNGAGKSTLLKILSRITRPTRGRVEIQGRVGSLLEVGTGFHPELTGRENVYLNGAMLGMSRSEIRAKFDSIVDFSETEEFLETPVKHYSSGMYIRLAFAVAAHLQPDILLVDEVLAVGDAHFQKKCLQKMREVSRDNGRTVLFVSHNMGAVTALTNRALYLVGGRIAGLGPTTEIVRAYLADQTGLPPLWEAKGATVHSLQILSVCMRDGGGETTGEFDASAGFTVELTYEVRRAARNTLVEFFIYTADGVHLMTFGDHDTSPERYELREPGRYTARVAVPGNLLNVGTYILRINSGTHHVTYDHEDAVWFRITESHRITSRLNRRGLVLPMLPWEVVEAQPA